MPEFQNKEPLETVRQAIGMLRRDEDDCSYIPRILHVSPDAKDEQPYIELLFDLFPSRFFSLTPACAAELKKLKYVQAIAEERVGRRIKFVPAPKGEKHSRFMLTPKGEKHYQSLEKANQEKARELLVPGTHGWSSQYRYMGSRKVVDKGADVYHMAYYFKAPANPEFCVLLHKQTVVECR